MILFQKTKEKLPAREILLSKIKDYETENNNSKQSVLSPEETDNQKQPVLSAKEANDTFSKTKEKLSAREILLSKIKDYETQKKKSEAIKPGKPDEHELAGDSVGRLSFFPL